MISTFNLRINFFLFKIRHYLLSYNHHKQITCNLINIKKISQKFSLNSKNTQERLVSKSYAAFILQSKSRPLLSLLILEFLSVLLILPTVFYFFIKKSNSRKINCKSIKLVKYADVAFTIPKKLSKNSKTLILKNHELNLVDLSLIFNIFFFTLKVGYFFNFQFMLKCIKEISLYSPIIKSHKFKNLIVFLEFDCCISIITLLCKKNNKKIINIQHGDQVISAHYAFVEVDDFYFWNRNYYKMFQKMKVKCKPFFFNRFKKLKLKYNKKYVYILEPQLIHFGYNKKIFNNFIIELRKKLIILNKKYQVIFRCHPRYCNSQVVNFFKSKDITIENAKERSTSSMIRSSICIIGTWSALFVEASMSNKRVILLKCELTKVLKKYHFLFNQKNVKYVDIKKLKINEI